MKHFYIICLILSSFFTYKSLSANTTLQKYAMFIPQGAFQQNQKVNDIRLMRPRHSTQNTNQPNKKTNATTHSSKARPAVTTTLDRAPTTEQKVANTKKKSSTTSRKTQPTQNIPTNTQPTPIEIIDETPTISAEIAEKIKQYQLDDNIDSNTETQIVETTPEELPTDIEDIYQKDVYDLLKEIPYPDTELPKFKQLYALYGMELRVLDYNSKLPNNKEQEETLAKSNSLNRFVVE